MEIREERRDDVVAVTDVHRAAFADRGEVVASLIAELRRVPSDDGLRLVAEQDGTIVGSVTFTVGLLDAPARLVSVQILSPLAVTPALQRRGIGAALIKRGLEVLSARGMPAVFLEGDPGYYSRLGFVAATPLHFRKPSLRIPDGAFQVMTLPAYQPWMTGTLVYADIFWRHDVVGLRDPA
jgi:putative acetyltransferase